MEEMRTELSTLQSKYETEHNEWQAQNSSLETQLEALKLEHDNQVFFSSNILKQYEDNPNKYLSILITG